MHKDEEEEKCLVYVFGLEIYSSHKSISEIYEVRDHEISPKLLRKINIFPPNIQSHCLCRLNPFASFSLIANSGIFRKWILSLITKSGMIPYNGRWRGQLKVLFNVFPQILSLTVSVYLIHLFHSIKYSANEYSRLLLTAVYFANKFSLITNSGKVPVDWLPLIT